MDRSKDPEKQISIEDLLREAEEIDREMAEANLDPMPLEIKERIKSNLLKQMDEYDKEHLYASLSEEDRKALKVGREMLKKKENNVSEEKVVYRKKKIRMYHVLAAVIVLVLAMGVTSMGGAERVIEMVKVAIGSRELVRVETSEDNYVEKDENEEEAYQKMRDIFGVDPIKLTHWPKGTKFVHAEIDEDLQTAYLIYLYKGNTISYFISSHYTESSWGFDIEDELLNQYIIKSLTGEEIVIKEYNVKKENVIRYSTNYTHHGLDYFLVGGLEKEQFEDLIKNLKFL